MNIIPKCASQKTIKNAQKYVRAKKKQVDDKTKLSSILCDS